MGEDVITLLTNAQVETDRIVAAGWDKHVQCEVDHPCCTVERSFMEAKQTRIQNKRSDIMVQQSWWQKLEDRRLSIEDECSEERQWKCDEQQSDCTNGEARDENCECDEWYPRCPTYACENGMSRDPETCACSANFEIQPADNQNNQ